MKGSLIIPDHASFSARTVPPASGLVAGSRVGFAPLIYCDFPFLMGLATACRPCFLAAICIHLMLRIANCIRPIG